MSTEDDVTNSREHIFQRVITGNGSNKSLYTMLSHKLGVLFSMSEQNQVLNKVKNVTEEGTQTSSDSLMDHVRREAEFMAQDVVFTFGEENARKPPNKYCKTLRRTVKELSAKHDLVFKGIVNRLKPDDENAIQTFVIVADELFDEGQVNWGRIVALYAFAAHLAAYLASNLDSDTKLSGSQQETPDTTPALHKEKIAHFVGKYIASKLGQWIIDHGGWDAFVEYFPDQAEFEAKIWKVGLLTAVGLGALATVVATR